MFFLPHFPWEKAEANFNSFPQILVDLQCISVDSLSFSNFNQFQSALGINSLNSFFSRKPPALTSINRRKSGHKSRHSIYLRLLTSYVLQVSTFCVGIFTAPPPQIGTRKGFFGTVPGKKKGPGNLNTSQGIWLGEKDEA